MARALCAQDAGTYSQGAQSAGRTASDFALDLEPVFHINEDREQAKEEARADMAMFINILRQVNDFIEPKMLQRMDLAIRQGDRNRARSIFSGDILDESALDGNPHQIIEKIEKKGQEVGLTDLGFDMPFNPSDISDYFHLLGKKCDPTF